MRNLATWSVSAAAVAVACFASSAALADPVGSTMQIQYFSVTGDSDFPGPNATVADGSSLGTHNLPVATGSNDINPGTSELTWWSPALNSHVVATGTGTVSLPYNSNMYAPNSTGSDDANAFETAILTGNFMLAGPGTVTFNIGSDDDTFVYIDGMLFGQNPGIHGVTNVNFTTPTLGMGNHKLQIFYADRERTGAFLSVNADASVTLTPPSAPEPASWAMMLGGFGAIGGALRSRRKATARFA